MPWFSVLLLPIGQFVLFRPRGNSNLWAWNKKEWDQVRWNKWCNENNTWAKNTSEHLTLKGNCGAGGENFFSPITFKLYHRHQSLGRLQGQPHGQESSHCNLPNAYVGYKYVYVGGEKMIISFSKRLERYLHNSSVQSFLASIFSSFFLFYF